MGLPWPSLAPPLDFQLVIGKICWGPVMATISPSAAALSTGEGVVVGVHDVSVDPDGGVREKLLYHMVFIRRQSTIWH